MSRVASRFTIGFVASVAACVALPRASLAADLPLPSEMRAAFAEDFASPGQDFDGWYLRGDLGMGNPAISGLDNLLYASAVDHHLIDYGFDSSPIFGLGFGYRFKPWLRMDVTGEYRGKSGFHGSDVYGGDDPGPNEYAAKLSSLTFLANLYADLGTWQKITPFVGAGIGYSRNTISGFTDVNIVHDGMAFAKDTSIWKFTWALHAGLAYQMTDNAAFEFAYRYLDMGEACSGDIYTWDGINNVNNPMKFKDLVSHDFKFGMRWHLREKRPVPERNFSRAPSDYRARQQTIILPPAGTLPGPLPLPGSLPGSLPPDAAPGSSGPPLMRRG